MTVKKKLYVRTALVIATLIILTVVYVGWMSSRVMGTWRSSHGQPSDCAIVLGAAVWEGKPSTAMRERLDIALQVYRDKLTDHLILSGGIGAGDSLSESQVMKSYLMEKGVPETSLLLEEQSHSTIQNLLNSQTIMREHGYSSAILVTHGFHALRASLMAKSIGIETSVEPVQIRPIDLRYYVLREVAGITFFELTH
ncbi:YdcF family protein [Paenibacillus sp. Soil787]|uniref:YdcF family protein n=1 Tax=Paenibacillus sp. Soil787 TaxID=1736411 RepID=UPI0006F3F0D4|nr:YdcF family protein [Paenibacillus sp. Soil787]KRF43578.1 hypothetical protein ASG93_01250 [Paenibacillus sp. Soil787]